MAENVQCPVCTLYLHAGMNLSDHLETHPKEQVIRALVQMTISGVGVGSSSALASVLAGGGGDKSGADDTKKTASTKLELEEKHLPNEKSNDLIIGGTGSSCSVASISNSASNCSLSNQSTTSSQNSNNTLNFNTTSNLEQKSSASEQDRTATSSPATPIKTTFKSEIQHSTPNSKDGGKVGNENINDNFPKPGFSQSSATTNSSHVYHAGGSAMELPNLSNSHTNFNVFGNQRYEQQQQHRVGGVSNKTQLHQPPPHMPPPPPPPTTSTQPAPAPSLQNQHSLQHQELTRAAGTSQQQSTHQQSITSASTGGGSFHTHQQQQQLPPPLPTSSSHHSSSHLGNNNILSNHRQPHMYPIQHQQPPNSHHPQSLKVIYTPALPPPPPLQLFTYQPPTHIQHHQKPPPAYGTAISQIRSQHNQSKHQVAGSFATPQHQQPTMQVHALQQQHQQQQQQHNLQQQQTLHHNLRIHVPPPPPTQPQQLPIPTKHLFSTKANELAAPSAPPPTVTTTTSTSSSPTSLSLVNTTTLKHSPQQQSQHLPKKSFPDLLQQPQQTDSNEQTQAANVNIRGLNSNEMANKTSKSLTSTNAAPSYPQVSISPSIASASMAAVAASSLVRHTNSPFAALLAAAAGQPSPSGASSVLRYAESPVAHYLERENGDFIVQETPKHIVECVEKDNGEFSVIERIYQSPPSVLHIHDDDEEDEDEDEEQNDEDNRDTDMTSDDEMKHVPKELETLAKDDMSTSVKSLNKMSIETKKSRRNSSKHSEEDNGGSDNEIVDFVSISSDSDDEEFISHERQKDHKMVIEKCKKDETSPITLSSTSIMSLSSSSSSTLTNGDHLTAATTSTTTLHCSASTSTAISQNLPCAAGSSTNSGGGGRKKSSKNTVTVLSDVQLNLNEYLDLVGNIIASSKVAAQRRTIAPLPMVKIEKEEPMDDYAMTATTTVTSVVVAEAATTATTNFEPPPPPLKANKHETDEIETDIPSSSSSKHKTKHNLSLINGQQQHTQQQQHNEEEQEDKKPQVFENIPDNCNGQQENLSAITNSNLASTSSHVTSVIRMATTSQSSQTQQQHLQEQLNKTDSSTEAEDLSQPQRKTDTIANSSKALNSINKTSLVRKGPKKLVIKPKSSRPDNLLSTSNTTSTTQIPNHCDRDQQPTTSAKAIQEYAKQNRIEEIFNNSDHIQVKNEPITSITYESHHYQQTAGFSILEQHLSSKDPPPILECKEEKPCITESSLPVSLIEMKIENNVNDDARVLYDFANSKKSSNSTNNNVTTPTSTTFPSSTSLFSHNLTTIEHNTNNRTPSEMGHNKNKNKNQAPDTSSYSSQSAMDATLASQENSTTNTSTTAASQHPPSHHNPQQTQVFTDFPFSYLYNGSNIEEQVDIKNHQQFTAFYQNVQTTTTTNNNNNSSMLMDDSSSSKHYADYQTQSQQQQQQPGTSQTHHQWFNSNNNNQNNYQTPPNAAISISSNQSTSNLNSSLSIDGNAALDGSVEVGKYLDLDACKREQNIDMIVGCDNGRITVPPPPPPSSSTSCSFTGTTDNSMAGICSTAATLNIRTDEKMPAKGEISEQESNCDIDNSWSQPMYGDISARFFKTTFPGIFPQDNGWNHDDYFTVQDLSASTTAQATNANSRMKSFEDGNNTGTGHSTSNNGVLPIFTQNSNDNCNIDVMPSTSSKIRKRRKRNSQDGKLPAQTSAKRMQPTSTITSQQMMMQHQNEINGSDFNFQQDQLQQQQELQQPSTSAAFLAGPSNAAGTTGAAASSSFMMQQPQPLNPQQQPQATQQKQRTKVYECGICNAKYSKLKDRNAHMIDIHNYIRQNRRLVCPTTGLATPLTNADMQDVALPTTSAASSSMLMPPLQNADCLADYKPGIVKIEQDNIQRDPSGMEPPISATLNAKTEVMEDDKKNLALVPMIAGNSSSTGDCVDTKLFNNRLSLALTTPTSKLTTLYRMLVSFNMTTLKANHSLSEFDENLIKSSIFFCYVCRESFNSVKMYDAHLTEHPAECFTCGKKFQRWKNFSLHLKRHLGWKEFGCTVCDKKFVVRSALVEHVRMHSGLSPLKCKVCGKHFKRYSNLTQHRKRHTKQTIRRKEYVCYCGEVLPSKARFLWHKETHDSKPKCCPHCCDRFVHVNSLRRHIRLAHSDKFNYNEPMECPICKQIFAKASMKAHMATHSTETQYDCAICRKSFSTKWNLKIHSWVHANRTSKPFKCEHCPKAFVREVDFKNHMNSHKQIKPYTCEVCGCKFIRKYNYMRHRREHHGNKKYTCDLCKKSFHRHYYLIEHRRIHTGERPFQCTICGKSSTTKTNHNKHLKIHHSRDPFTVEV